VILNLGTLTEDRAEAMLIAGKAANEKNIPIIIDPIAVGGTKFRTEVINELLDKVKFTAIRANAGEIAVLGGSLEEMKSPDSTIASIDPEIAKAVAKKFNTVVIATGKTDVITDGNQTALCKNGHPMLQNITASGCLLTSLVGPFVSVGSTPYEASITVTAAYGIAAERAMEVAKGPGTFIPALLDELYSLDQETIDTYKQIENM
jgi:hydroxyethylthiazole kinase